MRKVGYVGVISNDDAEVFYKQIIELIESKPQYEYEFNYTTEIQLNGKLLYTCLLIGRDLN